MRQNGILDMGIRLVTTIVGILAVAGLLFLAPVWLLVAVVCLLSAISAYELLGATGKLKGHALLYLSCACAFCVPFFTAWRGTSLHEVTLVLFPFGFAAFLLGIFDYRRVTFEKLSMAFLGAFILPYFLSSLLRIFVLSGDMGKYYVLIPCIAAWVSDMLAYATGKMFGRHKLAPHVSPKKTVEGAVGGLAGGALGICLFGFLMNRYFSLDFNYFYLAVAGIIGAAAGQCGDLAMSLIKRNVGIKDYGKIFPGHGGVLDRFDSILFTAPLFELFLVFTGVIGA